MKSISSVLRPKSGDEIEDLEKRGFRKKGKWRFVIDIVDLVKEFDQDEDYEKFRENITNLLTEKIDDISMLSITESGFKQYLNIIDEFKNAKGQGIEAVDLILEKLAYWGNDTDVLINSIF